MTSAEEMLVKMLHEEREKVRELGSRIGSLQTLLEAERQRSKSPYLEGRPDKALSLLNPKAGKIDLLRALREMTGLGLKEAKDAVEKMIAEASE